MKWFIPWHSLTAEQAREIRIRDRVRRRLAEIQRDQKQNRHVRSAAEILLRQDRAARCNVINLATYRKGKDHEKEN